MEAILRRQHLTLPIAPIAASLAALLVGGAVFAMPIDVLEGMATDSGIASLVTAAAPPLGMTARLSVAVLAALLIGGLLWFGLGLLLGGRGIALRRPAGERTEDGVPVLRRADAHPDAPPRRPVFANRDLGTPFLDVHAEPRVTGERPLPRNLDTPLSQYLHPLDEPLPPAPAEAVEATPIAMEAIDAVAEQPAQPLPILRDRGDTADARPIAPPAAGLAEDESNAVMESGPAIAAPFVVDQPTAETPAPVAAIPDAPAKVARIETFELTPMVRGDNAPSPVPAAAPADAPTATIHDLLTRLERGVARRAPVPPAKPADAAPSPISEESIEQTLAVLRQLAARAG